MGANDPPSKMGTAVAWHNFNPFAKAVYIRRRRRVGGYAAARAAADRLAAARARVTGG
jgi:hypothetical protein